MDLKTLQDAIEYGILDDVSLQQLVDMKAKEEMMKRHPYAITHLCNGRWQTYFVDQATGQRKTVKASTKEKLIDKLYKLYKEETTQEKKKMTDLFWEWLEYKTSVTQSSNTITRHKQHFKKYFENSDLFQKPVTKIDRLELEAFCNQLVKDNRLSSKEWVNVKTILNGMFVYAVDKRIIPDNLMEKVKVHVKYRQVTVKTGKTETYNSEERDALVEYLDRQFEETGDLALLAIKLNFYLGLRVGELTSLKWSDITDLKHLHVQREEIRNQETNETVIIDHTKTNRDRFVALVPKAIALLDKIREYSDLSTSEDTFIFRRDGERVRARQIAYILEKYAERSGLHTKSSHKIRKTYASNLNANGVPIDEIRIQLGHTNLQTTMAYLYNPLTEKETYERIKNAL